MPRSRRTAFPFASRSAVVLSLLAAAACERERPLLQHLDPGRTGVRFANTLAISDTLNVQTDVYVYNGAGVAVGDVNGDGRPDLYFAGNMTTSRLYLNQGDMRFEDVTEQAGVGTTRWATGVTMADVNADGRLDIYVSVSGTKRTSGADRANLLFVNEGNGRFSEQAARFGIADTSYTTHSAFLDYDRDGCLDLFVLNNAPQDFTRFEVLSHPGGIMGETPGSLNQLYRNRCDGTFENVSERAGILRKAGYGLGVAVADLNRDGWPDIYVSNDGAPNDVLYMNGGDGTFTDRAERWLKHASVAGMGVDVADVNDDGWPDILQVDMLPREMARRKRTFDYASYGSMLESRRRGFRDDWSTNTLQLSNGVTASGDVMFSEVGHLAGVSATDWSWSALLADFDNDGRRDVFISNGYPKAVNDLDYRATAMSASRPGGERAMLGMLRTLPGYAESNAMFRNDGDLAFTDVSAAWGLDRPGFSYGAAYADLDDDGRLDLVVSRIDSTASIYRNVGPDGDPRHWLGVRLEGAPPHRQALGASLRLVAGGRAQYAYHATVRGYMSSVDDRIHFGLGAAARVDTLEVTWPDGRRQVLTALESDRTLVVKQADATAPPDSTGLPWQLPRTFEPAAPNQAPAFVHTPREPQPDYTVQALLPYLLGRQGPALAVADVDGDSLDDAFVGGGPGGAARLFAQRRDGSFAPAPSQPWAADSLQQDWGAHFFDANGDGRPDLYVASGGYQLSPTSALLQDRLYVNQGGGRFVRDTLALPRDAATRASTAAVRSGDFDGDGRPDLFVGGRLTPRSWPTPAKSFLLRNTGGRFVDVTAQVAPELAQGLVTDAAWLDFDGDGRLDLVTVGEWMPVEFYRNDGTRLRRVTDATGLPGLRGWWFSLAVADVDGDGRADLIAGNLGLNHAYTTAPGRRFGLYAGDFTGNGSTDVVFAQEADGAEYPWAGLALLGREIYPLATRFPTAGAFSTATMPQAFGAEALGRALHHQADTFESLLLHNDGGGRFSARPLPRLAQIAPMRAIVPHDVDGDGRLDLLVAGNLYDAEPNTPRPDAGNGLWLRGDGRGGFTPVHPATSGLLAPRNVAGLALVRTPAGRTLLVANTADTLQAFTIRRP